MSTPTDQFANLSIDSNETQMAPTEEEVKHRALELRDVLSSFDENRLPIEFQAPIFNNITGKRPPPLRLRQADWTIPGNLAGTLLQWGAYNEQGWSFLSQIQSPASCAIAFSEKLNRRFEECIDEYDLLTDLPNTATAKDRIDRIAVKLNVLSAAIYEDRQRRELREIDTLAVALRALASICERTQVVLPSGGSDPPRRSSRRTSSLGDANLSLFAIVIRQSSSTDDPYMLDALELFSGAALKACLPQLVSINGQLNRYSAGETYIQRFESLQQKANEESQEAPPASSGASSGRSRGLEADPRPGSKRPPPSAEATPKRGKRSGGR